MTSTLNVYAHYVNGWCGKCGRRRNRDGACPNCDAWWSSPLVQIGLPLVAVLTVLMWAGISTIRADFPAETVARTDSSSAPDSPSSAAAASPRFSPGAPDLNYAPWAYPALPGGYRGAGTPTAAAPFAPHHAPAFAASVSLPVATPSLLHRQLADLERLRISVAEAARAFRDSQEPGMQGYPTAAAVPMGAIPRPRPDVSVDVPDAARNLQAEADVL